MPGVTKDSSLEVVLGSCQSIFGRQQHAQLSQDGLERFVSSLDPQRVKNAAVGPAFPLRFPSLEAEITAITLWNAFKFGSGYDRLLACRYQRSAKDVMEFGVLSMLLSSRPLDIHFMKAFSMVEVQGFFNLDPSEDHEVSPGITMSRPGELAPLCRMIRDVMNNSGRILEEMGHKTFGDFILSTMDDLKASRKSPQAAVLVQELCDCFPAFQDFGLYEDQKVTFSRKAQSLASDLYCVLQHRDDRFDFVDVEALTMDSGNGALAYFREVGVLTVTEDVRDSIEAGICIEQGDVERSLRAASVSAGHEIARRCEGAFSARELGLYITHIVQDKGELKESTPHLTRETMAY
ncbi:hypothetical protein BSKO_13522 [Bryopsis sp. KO-2023]|nr:hypothetical protein BSKO_13522 [Bryopsis sp. KO-2023]